MNAHLVLPALEVELPHGTSPPRRAPRPTGTFPAPDALPPGAYPTASADAAGTTVEATSGGPHPAVPTAGPAHAGASAAAGASGVGGASGVAAGPAGTAYGIGGSAGIGRGALAGAQAAPAAALAAARVELGRSASVGAPRRTGPSRPRTGGGGRAAGWLGVPQIVCWQLAMIVAGLGLREPVAVKVVAGVTALLLLTGVSVRWGGQWLYQWIGHGIRFCLRRRSLRAATGTTEPVVPALAKDTWTRAVRLDADAGGPAEAMTDAVADAGGLTAALWLPAGDGARIDALLSARDLLDVMEKQPVTMVAQAVLHTGTRPDEPARSWIAVRARRSADLADDGDLEAVLANGVRRIARRLDRLRIEAEPLTGQALPDTLAALAHVSAGRVALTEAWGSCRTGPVIQVTYRLAGFGQLPHAAAGLFLDRVLHRPERVATTVAVTAWRAPGAPTRDGTVLRIAAVNRTALDQAARDIARLAAEFGVRPLRLDGRHRAGVLASLPLGHTSPGGTHS